MLSCNHCLNTWADSACTIQGQILGRTVQHSYHCNMENSALNFVTHVQIVHDPGINGEMLHLPLYWIAFTFFSSSNQFHVHSINIVSLSILGRGAYDFFLFCLCYLSVRSFVCLSVRREFVSVL